MLAILELLKTYERVLYIDIDVHHGDGVEEAFLLTDRVLTCSFHKFRDFFPGTGNFDDVGFDKGRYHSVNFPLNEGVDDQTYEIIFRRVIDQIYEVFRPGAVVLQCGSDSLSGDKLGCFNLSVRGHGACVDYVKGKGAPVLLLGGGGYTLRNVPRCWTYETSMALGIEVEDKLPQNPYLDYFFPEKTLHQPVTNMENMNRQEELDFVLKYIYDNLRRLDVFSPGGAIEAKGSGNKKGEELFREQREINRENNEELSDRNRDQNRFGANAEMNV